MINSVEITNYLGTTLHMSLRNPVDSGFYIKKIEGIGPPKANVAMSEYCTGDGSRFSMARAEYRNITFQLGFLAAPSIEATRHRAYDYFPIKEAIRIKIESDLRTSIIDGYVESNEVDIFSREEGCTISVLCPFPYFRTEEGQNLSFYGGYGMFEFPWSNPVGSSDIILGSFYSDTAADLVYTGEVPTGCIIDIECTGTTGDITVHHYNQNKSVSVKSDLVATIVGSMGGRGDPIGAGDEIIITSVQGYKTCQLLRDGQTYNIIGSMDKDTRWMTIEKGVNTFIIACTGGLDTAHVSISNEVLYYGA